MRDSRDSSHVLSPARIRQWIAWLIALAVVTGIMFAARDRLQRVHVAFAYLLIVLGASARGGRALGLTLAIVAFGSFNFFFVPPYHTFRVGDPLDWLVLAGFLVTSVVAAQLLSRAQSEAAAARERALEVEGLSALGAETLNAARAEDALEAVADVIRRTLDVTRCEIYLRDDSRGGIALAAASGQSPNGRSVAVSDDVPHRDGESPLGLPSRERLIEWVAGSGQTALERGDGTVRIGSTHGADFGGLDPAEARAFVLPLRVRDRTVGVLRIAQQNALALDAAKRRFLETISYYAALGVERVRLVAEAGRAESLKREDEMKNALLASVSHDLRTPLTTIKALAHDIGVEGDERAVTIEEEADRLNRFVADLLDLSRLAAGGLALNIEINEVEDLVGVALQRVSGAQGSRAINVTIDSATTPLVGRFDFVAALRILVNLLENALKYSPSHTAIELRVRREGDALEFVVADRGRGVPPAERERIFEPLYRPTDSLPDVGGAGLGLAIARRLAVAQNGSVRHEPRDGGGSLFIVQLPAADVDSAAEGANLDV